MLAILLFQLAFRPWGLVKIALLYFAGVIVLWCKLRLSSEQGQMGRTWSNCFAVGFVNVFAFIEFPKNGYPDRPHATFIRSLLLWRCFLLCGMVCATVRGVSQQPALQQHLRTPGCVFFFVLGAFGCLAHLPAVAHQWCAGRWHADWEGASSTYLPLRREGAACC